VKNLKEIFYPEEIWLPKICVQLAKKLGQLKNNLRRAFSDLDEFEFIQKLLTYSATDLRDAIDHTEDTSWMDETSDPLGAIGRLLERSTGQKEL
jgi:hypothetical protein